MNTIKQIWVWALAALVITGLSSCESEGLLEADDNEAIVYSESETEILFEEVDDFITQAWDDAAGNNQRLLRNDQRLNCATITHDRENNTISIDFGDGCEDNRGTVRSGSILITYTGPRIIPGNSVTTTFENYYVDSVLVQGTRVVENTTSSLDTISLQVSLTDGSLTWPDGTSASREATRVRKFFLDAEDNITSTVTGGASGVNRLGTSYTSSITTELVFSQSCQLYRVPISGSIEITTSNENTLVVDYGDGECDRLATFTFNDGEPREVNLARMRFRRINN